ncbi:MAG: acyl-CoA dehydratase activase [Clostridiales bacterium]|nr:acyl-CoA dehydratase activase [Clostridiales bacterium]
MITAGVDVGIRDTKIIIMDMGHVVGKKKGSSGGIHRECAIQEIWKGALDDSGLGMPQIDLVAATGIGACDVVFAGEQVTEPVADARAARHYRKDATCVVDIGADQMRVIFLGEGNAIREVVLNQKCAAGIGIFFEYMARRLGMTMEEISSLPSGDCGAPVNDGCCVFAELDALEMLFQDIPKEDIFRKIICALSYRMNAVLNDKLKPAADTTLLIGGVSKNKAMINALRERSGIRFIIPEDAEYGCALGAALYAASQ